MRFQTIVFDLDETIYPKSCGLMTAVGQRIQTFMEKVTGLPPDEAFTLRRAYLNSYGTSLRGLQLHHDVDPEEYVAFVHDVNASDFLPSGLALDQMLHRLPQRKLIFTNGTREHADHILNTMAIAHHFPQIIDLRDFTYDPKPSAVAYAILLQNLSHEPEATIYLDDRIENLIPAARLGITTVHVSENGHRPAEVNYCINNVLELEEILL